MKSVRIGSSLVLVASSLSVAATVAASPASAAATSCPGTYTTTVKSNAPGAYAKKYKNTASKVTEQGTTCSNAHALAGAITRKECGGCKIVHTVDGYAIKGFQSGNLKATKGAVVVKFHLDTLPLGVTAD